jgi:hypothetical protein
MEHFEVRTEVILRMLGREEKRREEESREGIRTEDIVLWPSRQQ